MVNRRINFRMRQVSSSASALPVVRPLCAGLVIGSMLFVTEAQANHQGTHPRGDGGCCRHRRGTEIAGAPLRVFLSKSAGSG